MTKNKNPHSYQVHPEKYTDSVIAETIEEMEKRRNLLLPLKPFRFVLIDFLDTSKILIGIIILLFNFVFYVFGIAFILKFISSEQLEQWFWPIYFACVYGILIPIVLISYVIYLIFKLMRKLLIVMVILKNF